MELSEYRCDMFRSPRACYNAGNRVLSTLKFLNVGFMSRPTVKNGRLYSMVEILIKTVPITLMVFNYGVIIIN